MGLSNKQIKYNSMCFWMNLTCEDSVAVYLLTSQNVQKKGKLDTKWTDQKTLHKPPKVNQTLKKQTQQTETCASATKRQTEITKKWSETKRGKKKGNKN